MMRPRPQHSNPAPIDIVYGSTSRSAVRLKSAGYQLIQGPGPLVQVFRINTTRGPFKNEKFRQAFNYLMDRDGHPARRLCRSRRGRRVALGAGEPGLRRVLQHEYAFDLDKAQGAARRPPASRLPR